VGRHARRAARADSESGRQLTPAIAAGLVAAGALGAPARYLLDGFVQDRTDGAFPWGTFAINVSGSFLLGLITGAALYHAFPNTPKVWLGTGFCGAYTTFSTFTFETIRLLEDGDITEAWHNAAASLVVAALAAAVGLAIAAAV
jgi:CrcB protein